MYIARKIQQNIMCLLHDILNISKDFQISFECCQVCWYNLQHLVTILGQMSLWQTFRFVWWMISLSILYICSFKSLSLQKRICLLNINSKHNLINIDIFRPFYKLLVINRHFDPGQVNRALLWNADYIEKVAVYDTCIN